MCYRVSDCQETDFFIFSYKCNSPAAHCFQSKGIKEILEPEKVSVGVGKFNLSDSEIGSSSHPVKEIIIHPDWEYNVTSFDADIAIVVLAIPVKINHQFVGRVCLPIASIEEVSGTGTVVGWGKSKVGSSHDQIPNKLEVPAVTSEQCYLTFPELAKISSNRSFCGGLKDEGKAPCFGDSGGGFYLLEGAYWDIRGIVSSSTINRDRGCSIDKYTVYTNVAKFVGWIKSMMSRSKQSNTTKNVEFACHNSR